MNIIIIWFKRLKLLAQQKNYLFPLYEKMSAHIAAHTESMNNSTPIISSGIRISSLIRFLCAEIDIFIIFIFESRNEYVFLDVANFLCVSDM